MLGTLLALEWTGLQRRVRFERPKLAIIFIPAHYDEIRRRALGGGAVNFMHKPFDAVDLLTAINRAVHESPNE
jgi:FixJ family two-component response regulator